MKRRSFGMLCQMLCIIVVLVAFLFQQNQHHEDVNCFGFMQRKMVVKVHSLNGQKSRSKALQIVFGFSGIESATLKGEEMNQIEVMGDNIDAVAITTLLRKKLGSVELLAVAPVEKRENTIVQLPPNWSNSTYPYGTYVPRYAEQQLNDYDPAPGGCSIM